MVFSLKKFLELGIIKKGTELWIFTDNMVAEATFYKGSSKGSKLLHRLVEILRGFEIDGLLFVYVVWIAGTRMILQGIDGISRGDRDKSMLARKNFLSILPLNESVLERWPLKEWVTELFQFKEVKFRSYNEWYDFEDFDKDVLHCWTPPPCVADVCVERLVEGTHI